MVYDVGIVLPINIAHGTPWLDEEQEAELEHKDDLETEDEEQDKVVPRRHTSDQRNADKPSEARPLECHPATSLLQLRLFFWFKSLFSSITRLS